MTVQQIFGSEQSFAAARAAQRAAGVPEPDLQLHDQVMLALFGEERDVDEARSLTEQVEDERMRRHLESVLKAETEGERLLAA